MTKRLFATCACAAALVACGRGETKHHGPPVASVPTPAASVAPVASGTGAAVAVCGNTPCRIFQDDAAAFAHALEKSPRVLGIGEAHALAGAQVESATRRFTRDLLPLLNGRATDLVVEVLVPNPRCVATTKAARQEQKVVTDRQAPTDQNDFVALGTAASGLGIRPFALEPTCDDLARIAKGGEDAVAASLDAVTRLTKEKIERLVAERGGVDAGTMIVAYGGAMHNDAAPAKGRDVWSYGPAMTALTRGRYVELDVIVREFVRKSPAWESLPWFKDFDPAASPRNVTLFQPSDGAFVLIFAESGSVIGPR